MFKKPIKADITVTHELKIEDKEYIDRKVDEVKRIFKEAFIILAVGVPCAIIFGFAAHVASEIVIENATSQQ